MLLPLLLFTQPAAAALDLAFVLDTTGSMSGEITEAQQRIRQLSEALRAGRPGETVRIGVVAFRDWGDAYLTEISPLQAEIEPTFAFLARLEAGGGGDGPEDVLSGLGAAIDQLAWARGAEHQVFLIGDAPPHLDYPDSPTAEALISRAREREIVLNAIGCRSLPSAGVAFFRKMAFATEGAYQHIGRVQVDDGGIAEAVLGALVESTPAVRTPIDATAEKSRLQPPGEALANQGVLVRLGTWWQASEGVAPEGPACTLTVLLPTGVDLARTPRFETSTDGLFATLQLESAPSMPAQTHGFELSRCVGLDTPVHVDFQ